MTAAAVLQMLEEQVHGGPAPLVLTEFMDAAYSAQKPLWGGWITPAVSLPAYVTFPASNSLEFTRQAREAARVRFPGQPFTTSHGRQL